MSVSQPLNFNSILFVCTGNSCRSVMAHYKFEQLVKEHALNIRVASAGTMKGGGLAASPETVELLSQEGIDASHHISSELTEDLLVQHDLICVMTRNHAEFIQKQFPDYAGKVRLLSEFYEGADKPLLAEGVPDPIGMGMGFYQRVYGIVSDALTSLITRRKA